MRHLTSIKNRPYTLVEVMVALAVLVLMMSFLFQFVIGAQRVWHGNTRRTSLFEKAQVVFDVLEQDLKASRFSADAGRQIPFYLNQSTMSKDMGKDLDGNDITSKVTKELYFGMWTATDSEGKEETGDHGETLAGTYPVLYFFTQDESSDYYRKFRNTLYRCTIDDNSFAGSSFDKNLIWYSFGYDKDNASNDYYKSLIQTNDPQNPFYNNLDECDVIADGILNINIEVLPATTDHYFTTRPKAVRVSLTLYDPASVTRTTASMSSDQKDEIEKQNMKKIQETSRSFSKIIFID